MAAHFEKVLVQHVVVPASLAEIVERELPADLLPSDDLGAIFRFAHDYWHNDPARMIAPSPEALRSHQAFATALAEHEIDLDIDPEDTLEWALAMAQGAYIDRTVQPWIRAFATNIVQPDIDLLDKPVRLDEAVQDLMEIQGRFSRRSEHVDVRQAMVTHLAEYEIRAQDQVAEIRGARLGMPELDVHTGGIRDGELCILGGGPKTGKSFWELAGAYEHWFHGGIPVLYTLENSVEMTVNRLACARASVDSRRWDRGQCNPAEMALVRDWVEFLTSSDRPFHIIQPEPGKRTMEAMIRRARTLGDAVYIDQLTFVEPPKVSERKQRHEQIRDILHECKSLLSSGTRMPGVLAHQINREGIKAAEKSGHLELYNMAEGSEVERTADWVFTVYQGAALRDAGHALIQTLAARRADLLNWQAIWRPHLGDMRIRTTVQLMSTP